MVRKLAHRLRAALGADALEAGPSSRERILREQFWSAPHRRPPASVVDLSAVRARSAGVPKVRSLH
ncbi:MAG TPA: hypothetical protein VKY73_09040 [Polyangiaceae bacterium]|nr:hypothetical protein [Polyangiaceae bacterium]